MAIPRYFINKIYQALFVVSGVFIGVNNHALVDSFKDRVASELRPKTSYDQKFGLLEQLVELKENETNNLYWASNR